MSGFLYAQKMRCITHTPKDVHRDTLFTHLALIDAIAKK